MFSILFFVLYIGVVIVIGFISARKETEEGFMLADRNIGGLQVPATMSAGFFDGATLAVYIAYVYQYGISAAWLFVGFAIGFLFLRNYFVGAIKRQADETRVYSMPEYFYKMFGKTSGLMFSLLLVVQLFFLLVINFIVAGKVLSSIFSLPYALGVIIGGLIILTYLLLAGFKAVVKTDFFQLLIMFLMSVSVAVFFLGSTTIPTSEFAPFNVGAGNIVGFLLLGGMSIMVAPDLWQRIFATRDEKTLRKGLGYVPIILMALAAVISIVGLATKQFFPDIAPEDALVTGFSQLLPFGLKEFGMVLLYAVALSSSDTITFVVSSIFTRDLQNYTKRFSRGSMRRLTRVLMVFFVTLAILVGLVSDDVITIGLSLGSLSLALFPPIVGSFRWNLNSRAVTGSLILSSITVVILAFAGAMTPENTMIVLPVSAVSLFLLQKIRRRKSHVPT